MTPAQEGHAGNLGQQGGHGGAADNAQRAWMNALIWTFLHRAIGR